MKRNGIKMALLGIIMLGAVSAVVMLLWNLLLPSIFGLANITFWQATGLLILSRILFGNFGGRRPMGGRMHHSTENPMHKKWIKMTPEQRKEFIEKRRRFGFGGPFGREHFDMDKHEEPTKENE